jgi:hypothetical protein
MTATAVQASAAPVSAPAPAASAAPIGRSPVPTVADWKGASKLSLDGAEWVSCVAEGVREWVRVSCRGEGRAGTPISVMVTRGKGPDVVTYMKDGVTSVLFRFVPGTDLEAIFAWNEDEGDSPMLPLAVRWPKEASAAPSPIGAFAGVPASLSPERRRAECDCYWQRREIADHATRPSATDPCKGAPEHTFRLDCLRTETGAPSCPTLIGCTQFPSPDVLVRCAPGSVHVTASPTAYCGRACSAGEPCPPGFTCEEDAGHEGVRACSFDKAP